MSLLIKYRPHSFDEVVGHEVVVASLRNAVRKNSARAFLFTGDSGLGKTTLARLTAEALGAGAAGVCEIDAATYSGVDDMREITAGMINRPLMSKISAVIIDEVQGLSKAAWNSLLKATEEPPPWAYWFFCTTEAAKVPKTMRTRCLSYDLKPVGRAALTKLADRVVDAEQIKLVPEALRLCVEKAGGSPRQLLANLAMVAAARSKADVLELLELAEENPQAVELARALAQPTASWTTVRPLLAKLEGVSAETVRHVVCSYFTKVALNEKFPSQEMDVLERFAQPFNSADGMSPLVLACMQLLVPKR